MSLPGTALVVDVLQQNLQIALHTKSTFDQWTVTEVSKTVNDVKSFKVQITWNHHDSRVLPSHVLIHAASDRPADDRHNGSAQNGSKEHSSAPEDSRSLVRLPFFFTQLSSD